MWQKNILFLLLMLYHKFIYKQLYIHWRVCKILHDKLITYKTRANKDLVNKIGREKARKYGRVGRSEARVIRVSSAMKLYNKIS